VAKNSKQCSIDFELGRENHASFSSEICLQKARAPILLSKKYLLVNELGGRSILSVEITNPARLQRFDALVRMGERANFRRGLLKWLTFSPMLIYWKTHRNFSGVRCELHFCVGAIQFGLRSMQVLIQRLDSNAQRSECG